MDEKELRKELEKGKRQGIYDSDLTYEEFLEVREVAKSLDDGIRPVFDEFGTFLGEEEVDV